MKTMRWTVTFRSTSPAAHSQGSDGNISAVMRQPFLGEDGIVDRVPIISADSLRHNIREGLARHFLDVVEGQKLWESALRLLFNGGVIAGAGKQSKVVNLDSYRQMSDAFPHLGLLGGCVDGRTIPGRVSVGAALLVCAETAKRTGICDAPSYREQLDMETRVRMDAALSPELCEYLTDEARALIDAARADGAKSEMMPRETEVVQAGARWWWQITARVTSDIEVETMRLGIYLALRLGVGGKKGTGHGDVELVDMTEEDLGPTGIPLEALRPDIERAAMTVAAHYKGVEQLCFDFLKGVDA